MDEKELSYESKKIIQHEPKINVRTRVKVIKINSCMILAGSLQIYLTISWAMENIKTQILS